MLVLVFVYPIKLMAQATVLYISDDKLGTDIFALGGWDDNQVAILFVYFGIGLIALSAILIALYLNALRHKDYLRLTPFEETLCKRNCATWATVSFVAGVSCAIALIFFDDRNAVVMAGNVYFSLFLLLPVVDRFLTARWSRRNSKFD
jgi:hypothetical protein